MAFFFHRRRGRYRNRDRDRQLLVRIPMRYDALSVLRRNGTPSRHIQSLRGAHQVFRAQRLFDSVSMPIPIPTPTPTPIYIIASLPDKSGTPSGGCGMSLVLGRSSTEQEHVGWPGKYCQSAPLGLYALSGKAERWFLCGTGILPVSGKWEVLRPSSFVGHPRTTDHGPRTKDKGRTKKERIRNISNPLFGC